MDGSSIIGCTVRSPSPTPWTKKLWVYDLRTNKHFTLKTNRMKRGDLDEFVRLYTAKKRKATWSEKNPDGRWRAYDYAEIAGEDGKGGRDKCSLDLFWLKDESLLDADNLPDPDVIVGELVEDLRAALAQLEEIQADLGSD